LGVARTRDPRVSLLASALQWGLQVSEREMVGTDRVVSGGTLRRIWLAPARRPTPVE